MIESNGPFRVFYKDDKNHLWIRMDVTPPYGQGRDAFYKCGEAYCAINFGLPKPLKDTNFRWQKNGTSFRFKNPEDLHELYWVMKEGFSPKEESNFLIKRKLILGNLADNREFI